MIKQSIHSRKKNIVLSIGQQLADSLKDKKRRTHIFNKNAEYLYPAWETSSDCTPKKADLSISIHADASIDRKHRFFCLSSSRHGVSGIMARTLAERKINAGNIGKINPGTKNRYLQMQ
ncbi:MAG: N-acetylmuramoyl-L-alanine amidase [Proteobacteria bacterium]|nr:N-acetylmuramoyl-L-alanine amidase [Pseudomonadota bacterium]